MDLARRNFVLASLAAGARAPTTARNWMQAKWKIDARCVLPRGGADSFDRRVVGDPCVLWDEEIAAWRMFYFASPGSGIAGMAVSKSAEDIAPGDWRKTGPVPLVNPSDLAPPANGHKFWVVMDPRRVNRAARIGGRYWGLFVVGSPKHVYAASAELLGGPWIVVKQPILSPGAGADEFDGKHCDTPTAYWFEDRKEVVIFYKAYPLHTQGRRPASPFGSSTVTAYWHPRQAAARKGRQILLPGRDDSWNRGWIGGFQLLFNGGRESWYALLNGSPTPPEDRSNREPAPSLGGWAVCERTAPDGRWRIDREHSPFAVPEKLSQEEQAAGLGVNFWRHHLLVTPGGRARIFFNSGKYGTEQVYSLVAG